jgi:hypothetical protein
MNVKNSPLIATVPDTYKRVSEVIGEVLSITFISLASLIRKDDTGNKSSKEQL